jgi:outer membrane protein OmpA-like peptidoglycan-associated protein/tetratricopeptide (TPR) repeat protein
MGESLIKRVTLISMILGFSLHLLGQQDEVKRLKKWELGDYAHSAEMQNDMYSAMVFYTELLKRNPDDNKLKLQLAHSYYRLRDYNEAYELYNSLIALNDDVAREAKVFMARCLIHRERYDEAKQILRKIRSEQRKSKSGKDHLSVDVLLESCEYGLSMQDSIVMFEVYLLSEGVNNKHKEFNPFLINDSLLVYGSYMINEIQFQEEADHTKSHFYKSELADDHWLKGVETEAPFYNFDNKHTGDGCFSVDKKRFYFSQTEKNYFGLLVHQLYVTELKKGNWTEPIKLKSDINLEDYSTSQPTIGTCYDPDLEVLYFISNRKNGYGKTDIWYSIYNKKTKSYSKCLNAGIFINTPGSELTPYYDLSTHTMYFSSDGWSGLGGVDVLSSIGETTNWQEPQNLGLGINTSYDDQDFYIAGRGNYGFITSNRPSAIYLTNETCCDNIYGWKRQLNAKRKVKGQLMQTRYQIGKMDHLSIEKQDSVMPLTMIPLNVYINKDTSDFVFIDKIYTDEEGRFEYLAPIDYNLKFVIDDPRVLDKEINLDANTESDEDLVIKTEPVKTLPKQAIILNNIYYETNKYSLIQESKANIDSTLLKLLKQYEDLSIEIISHTDNQGTDKYNMKLSHRRANSVVKYLIENGINKHRLIAVGKGESEPLAENTNADGSDNPEGRALNRRTEFKVHYTE